MSASKAHPVSQTNKRFPRRKPQVQIKPKAFSCVHRKQVLAIPCSQCEGYKATPIAPRPAPVNPLVLVANTSEPDALFPERIKRKLVHEGIASIGISDAVITDNEKWLDALPLIKDLK